jgi:hypothetical protein
MKREKEEEKAAGSLQHVLGGFEPGHIHILNVLDSIYYMGVTFLLHEDCSVPNQRQYPCTPRSEFRSTYPHEVTNRPVLVAHSGTSL